MVIAEVGDTAYNIVLTLHIAAVLVAFAPAVVHPLTLLRTQKGDGQDAATRLAGHFAANSRRVYFPALIAVGVFGGAMIGMSRFERNDGTSDLAWQFEQVWVWLGILLWIAICGVVSGVIMPAERKMGEGDAAAEKRVAVGGQIATLLVVVQLYLMVFQPGV